MPQLHELVVDVVQGQTQQLVLHGPQHQQTLPQRGPQGVHQADLPLGEVLVQLVRRQLRAVEGAADARGHPHKENVQALLQDGPHDLDIVLGIDLRGGDLRALPHGPIEGLPVKAACVQAGMAGAVDKVGEGDDGNIVLLRQLCGQIGGGIRDNLKQGKCPLASNITY